MNATLSTPEKTMQVSDEMLNAFLTLVSLTTKFSLPETIGHQPVFEQGPGADLGTDGGVDDAGLQVDPAVAQGRAVLVGLLQEVEAHARSLGRDAGDEGRAEILHEAVAGPQGEGPLDGRALVC